MFAGHAKDELKALARAALRRERAAIVEHAHMLAALLPGLMYRLSLHGPASGRAPQAADEPEAAPTHELPALGTEQPAPRAPGRLSLAILFVTVASVVAVVADWRSPVRSVLALGFLLFAPGLALTEMLAIREPFERLALIAAGSLALETVVAVPLLYAGAFSLNLMLILLAGLIVAALAVAAIRARRPAAESRGRRSNA